MSSSLKGTSVKIAINSAITLEMGSYTYPELSSLLSVENLAENYFVSLVLPLHAHLFRFPGKKKSIPNTLQKIPA